MIVGHGLIAQKLKEFASDPDVLVFASGVSDSSESNEDLYRRETDLLRSLQGSQALLLYFGTVSVTDPSLQHSRYIRHKLAMERLIPALFKRWMVIRLPNLVSDNPNPNTFFNFFCTSILQGKQLKVQQNAARYFLDADDLPAIVRLLLNENSLHNSIVDVTFDNKIKVTGALQLLEELMNLKANVMLDEGGGECRPHNKRFIGLYEKNYGPVDKDYTRKCFEKYVRLKASL